MVKKYFSIILPTFFTVLILYRPAYTQDNLIEKESFKFGGSIRVRAEYRDESDFDTLRGENVNIILQRIRLNLITPAIEKTYGFIELQDSRNWGSEISTVSNDNNLDLHQGYFESKDILELLSLRIGRQELIYADERIIGAFGWGNVGRSFDAGKIRVRLAESFLDIFFSKVKEIPNEYFHGIYSSCSNSGIFNTIDGYVLFKKSMSGKGMNRYTSGIRTKEKISSFVSIFEFMYQFGKEGEDKISAYAFDINGIYTFESEINPFLGIEYAYASGAGDKSDTFDNLFPTNHDKYGYMDYQGLRNIKNVRFTAGIKPGIFDFSIDYNTFRLAEVKDAWYNASGVVYLQDTTGNSGDDVGSEIDITIKSKLMKNISLLTGYSKFLAGDFVKKVVSAGKGAPSDSNWFFLQVMYNF